ncbi:metal-dependent hydrolase [Halovivax cerinus]|uniref:Metal-dependent hydrolase n=1 Tax=Halovivax cerinus TaxID=1487865 RepID=A0ABD5NR66_9EURY|nr:metal-dependent hydrolase [Halovivax cerinus]
MWPWEHVLVGYLAYSLLSHLWWRDRPGGTETVAVAVGALLPDLVDKPLAWEFGVFESGYALGHSLLFALPLSIVAGVVAGRLGRVRAGVALAVGYLLHLPGDLLYGYVQEGVVHTSSLLWPIERGPNPATPPGFREQVAYFLGEYRDELASGDLSTYVLIQFGLAGLVVVLWLYDGAPVLREFFRAAKRLGHRFLTVIG